MTTDSSHIKLTVSSTFKERVREQAEQSGMNLQSYILHALNVFLSIESASIIYRPGAQPDAMTGGVQPYAN